MPRNFRLMVDKLSEESQVLLDIIELLNSSDAESVEEITGNIDSDILTIKNKLATSLDNQELSDKLLDAISRLTKMKDFFNKYFISYEQLPG